MRSPVASVLLFALACAGCASSSQLAFWTGFRDHPPGYLSAEAAPDARSFLPAPPEPGSLEEQADRDVYRRTRALAGTERWETARRDNEIETPAAPRIFDEALGVRFEPERMPTLTRLLGRMLGDLETVQASAKRGYSRQRPFVAEPAATCIAPEPWLASSGSYPSGHAALGWAWALILAEMAPDRAEAVLARGLAYGESRVICGVHYRSDIEAGRLVGAALVAGLKSDPEFQRDFLRAGSELAQARLRSEGRRP